MELPPALSRSEHLRSIKQMQNGLFGKSNYLLSTSLKKEHCIRAVYAWNNKAIQFEFGA